MSQFEKRSEYTKNRIKELQNGLSKSSKWLGDKACVYATGSFGRLEAYGESDLDLFIVGKARSTSTGKEDKGIILESQLKRLDVICIKADLIEITQKLEFPEFDGDGKYLMHYSVDKLIKLLGSPDDDAENTLTGRLLLFLESRPLLGDLVYSSIIEEVLGAYWRDYEDHKNNFKPAFLANDILRLWRTFCVNYEARTKREPEGKKIEGKIKNYKLGHSRIITCYSALLYLLAVYKAENTVTPQHASDMTKLTPTERLFWLEGYEKDPDSKEKIRNLISQYDKFLEITSVGKEELTKQFLDKKRSKEFIVESKMFGQLMFEAVQSIGGSSDFYRMIVV